MILLQQTLQQRLPMLFNELDNPKNFPFPWGNLNPHLIHGSLGSHESAPQNGISTVGAVFSLYISVTSTQTHRPRYVWHL